MTIDARWTPAAFAAAVLMLYFTPWLTLGDGSMPSGFHLLHMLIEWLPGMKTGATAAGPMLVAGAMPAVALLGLLHHVNARRRGARRWFGGGLFACGALALWLIPFIGPSHTLPAGITLGGLAAIAAAVGLAFFAWRHEPVENAYGIAERYRRDGSVAIDVEQNRWRPLNRLLSVAANAAVVVAALTLWLAAYFPDVALFALLPLYAIAIVATTVALIAASRVARRRSPAARIVIDDHTLAVVAGGDRGRYPRAWIGGIYVPQHTDDTIAAYYDHQGTRNTLTLPVASRPPRRNSRGRACIFGDSRASVAMNLRERTIRLARHLTDAQARELVRRLTIRLLD